MPRKHIVILGAGESGVGAALLAKWAGYEVRVSDSGTIRSEYKARLVAEGIPFEGGQHDFKWLFGERFAERPVLVIKSPGISPKAPVVAEARKLDIPVISEIEWGFRYSGHSSVVAITGTNGKTTATTLTHHLLRTGGRNVYMAGNVGNSFSELIYQHLKAGNTHASRVYVLEVSSFQLEDIVQFRPRISVLLNITPDHLDRYDSMEQYIAAKFRIVENQGLRNYFLYNAEDPNIMNYLNRHPLSRVKGVAISQRQTEYSKLRIGRSFFDLSETALRGPHNALNAAFAAKIAELMSVEKEKIREGLHTYTPPAHRMEVIAQHKGITWINDSKATNVDATYYALQAMKSPVVWIAGGLDKGNDYTRLLPLISEKVRAIVCLGADNRKLLEAFQPLGKPIREARSAEQAVQTAAQLAHTGDTILLSPACASFDLFKNFEDRGDQFRAAAIKYLGKPSK